MELLAWKELPKDAAVTDIAAEADPELCQAIVESLCWNQQSAVTALGESRRRALDEWKQRGSRASLVVSAALPGEFLSEKEVDPIQEPELSRFLLRAALDERVRSAPGSLIPSLRKLGVYLPRERLPAPPRFRCEVLGPRALDDGLDLELDPSASLQFDDEVPAEVDPFGSLSQVLERERPLLWQADPRTGMSYPIVPSEALRDLTWDLLAGARSLEQLSAREKESLISAGLLLPRGWAERQAELRIETARRAGEQLAGNRYTVLRNMIPQPLLTGLQRYISDLRSQGYLRRGDRQVPGRLNIKNNPAISIVHLAIGSFLEQALRRPLISSMGYLSIYLSGAELHRHKDRPQNEWNVSVMIDRAGPEELARACPLKLGIQNGVKEIHLEPGDLVAYSGTQVPHWRDPVPAGQELTVCTYHFVERGFRDTLL